MESPELTAMPIATGQTASARELEDAQEYRAYLQRGETRLSTVHRVAGSFLSGAGLLTLLPVLLTTAFSDLFSQVVFQTGAQLPSPGSQQRWLALYPVVVSLFLPLLALVELIRDLVGFYFTAHHFTDTRHSSVVYPRFILSGIKVSSDALSTRSQEALDIARERDAVVQLLVPTPEKSRKRLLREAHGVHDLRGIAISDNNLEGQLRNFVLRYTASDERTLEDEAAKMEASLARHHMLIRALVLRYAKAFLLTLLTLLLAVIALAILRLPALAAGDPSLDTTSVQGQYVWIALLGLFAVWGLSAAVVVRLPIQWIYRDSDSTQSKRTPQSLARFERITLRAAVSSNVVSLGLLLWFAVESSSSTVHWVSGVLITVVAAATLWVVSRAISREGREPD
jgi:hypothetical protein